jgi:hypothetical protein
MQPPDHSQHSRVSHPSPKEPSLDSSPNLKIFLASNQLTTLPGGLFNLDRLTTISDV